MAVSRISVRLSALVLIGALALGGAACGDDDDDDEGAAGTITTALGRTDQGGQTQLVISDLTFPEDIRAQRGEHIKIVNSDPVNHTVTSDDASIDIEVAASADAEFDAPNEPGEYEIHCRIHPDMTTTLIVLS